MQDTRRRTRAGRTCGGALARASRLLDGAVTLTGVVARVRVAAAMAHLHACPHCCRLPCSSLLAVCPIEQSRGPVHRHEEPEHELADGDGEHGARPRVLWAVHLIEGKLGDGEGDTGMLWPERNELAAMLLDERKAGV